MGQKEHTGVVKTDEIAQENELLSSRRRTAKPAFNQIGNPRFMRLQRRAQSWEQLWEQLDPNTA